MTQQKASSTALDSLTVSASNISSSSNEARALKLKERTRKRQEASSVNGHIFVQRVDPLTGNVEWVVVQERIPTAHQTDQTERFRKGSDSDRSKESIGENVEDWNDFVVKSSYLDMLNDEARNQAYAAAIKKEVQPGDLVLDLGTGTGLLSMLAARSLEEKAPPITSPNLDLNPVPNQKEDAVSPQVITCESFPVMARLAERVIQENGLAGEIKVINKRSDELTLGPGQDLPRRADFLVSEILDSELLGEGLLPTLRDAWARLLRPGARTVPARARVFAQLVECEYLQQCHDLAGREADLTDGVRLASEGFKGLEKKFCAENVHLASKGFGGLEKESCEGVRFEGSEENSLNRTEGFKGLGQGCLGRGPPAWAVHADAFGQHLKQLSDPFPVFDFDFGAPPEGDRRVSLKVTSCADGTAHGLITWWEIDLDAEGSITYTTAPEYALKNADAQHANVDVHSYRGWHNHWRQCAYPFPGEGFRVSKGSAVSIEASHDDLGLWYRARLKELWSEKELKERSEVLGEEESLSKEPAAESGIQAPSQNQSEQNRGAVGIEEENLAEEYIDPQQQQREPSISGHVAADKWSCTCGMHEKQSPERVGLLGDPVWREKMSRAVRLALGLDGQMSEVSSKSRLCKTTKSEASAEPRSNEVSFQSESEARAGIAERREHLDSELRCRLGAKTEGYGSLGEQEGVVSVADDSPLLPLLAARQLSENFGQSKGESPLKTGRLPSSQQVGQVAQISIGSQLNGGSISDSPPSTAVFSSVECRTPQTETRCAFGKATVPKDAKNPTEARGVKNREVLFAAKNGPASVEGFMHRRAAASEYLPGFVPQRLQSTDDLQGKKIAALLAEPWYATCDSGPPWAHALRFWHQRTSMSPFLLPGAAIMPYRAVLRGVAIHATELWESRRALSRVQGFDHSSANQLLGACGLANETDLDTNSEIPDAQSTKAAEKACSEGAFEALKKGKRSNWKERASKSDGDLDGYDFAKGCPVLSFPLWQCGTCYQEVSEPFDLLTFDFSREMTSLEGTAEVLLNEGPLSCHGLALWMEYQLSGDERLATSTGWSPGEGPSFHRQGVLLFKTAIPSSHRRARGLQARSKFDSNLGNVLIHVTSTNK